MEAHHISGIRDQREQCLYCKKDHSDCKEHEWDLHFHASFKYRTMRCKNCGRRISIPVKRDTSGHDTWFDETASKNAKKDENIDKKVWKQFEKVKVK